MPRRGSRGTVLGTVQQGVPQQDLCLQVPSTITGAIIPHWPLPAVCDSTLEDRLSVLKLSKVSYPGNMRTHGTPSKATITNNTRPVGSFSSSVLYNIFSLGAIVFVIV